LTQHPVLGACNSVAALGTASSRADHNDAVSIHDGIFSELRSVLLLLCVVAMIMRFAPRPLKIFFFKSDMEKLVSPIVASGSDKYLTKPGERLFRPLVGLLTLQQLDC
jgi:hypothetical protein